MFLAAPSKTDVLGVSQYLSIKWFPGPCLPGIPLRFNDSIGGVKANPSQLLPAVLCGFSGSPQECQH